MTRKGKFPMDEMVHEKPPTLRRDYAQQLADEMKTLVPGMERLAEIATELRADDLYRLLGYGTWDEFCTGYLGVSKRTANRWIAGPKPAIRAAAAKTETAGESAAPGHSVPLSDAPALKVANTPPAAPIERDPVVAFTESEGVEQDGETRSVPLSESPSDPTPEGAGVTVESPPPAPSGSSSVPTVKQLLRTLHTLLDEIDPTEAFNVESEDQRERHAEWIKEYRSTAAQEPSPAPAKRRQGTVSRPEDRAKAKLEVVPVDPATCDHPKEKRKKLAYGNLCERCGRMVA